ncbi:MAG: hypothetical protein NVSMB14_04050 [Isosphaeraceae bacterium]
MPDSKASRDLLALGWAMTSEGLGLGLEFLLPTLVGLYLDHRWKSTPWATLTGTVLGFAVGMLHIVRIAKKSSRTDIPGTSTERNTNARSSDSDRSGGPNAS